MSGRTNLRRPWPGYVARYEGSENAPLDQNQFINFSKDGRITGVRDIAVVRYLMETMCMFVMGRELYIYRDGCYYLDQDGIKVKAVVSKLIPEKFITFRCLSAVYNLLIEQQELQKSLEELNAYPPW